MPPQVRLATRHDLQAIAATYAEAFEGSTWLRWTIDAQDHRARIERLFRIFACDVALKTGEVWTTDDHAAVASWMPPGVTGPDLLTIQPYLAELPHLFGDRMQQATEAGSLLGPHRPKARHWYLSSMATRPGMQGKGLGAAILAPMLARCDRERLPIYAESSDARNVPFYRRNGFEVTGEFDVPGGGPHVWLLWREAR